jgi:hypothetical protein
MTEITKPDTDAEECVRAMLRRECIALDDVVRVKPVQRAGEMRTIRFYFENSYTERDDPDGSLYEAVKSIGVDCS